MIVDDLYPRYSAALIQSIGWDLSGMGLETILLDGLLQFPRLNFALRTPAPGICASHFRGSPEMKAREPDVFVQIAPALHYFLPRFNLDDFRRLEPAHKMSILRLIRRYGFRSRFLFLRVPPEETSTVLSHFATDVIFLLPAEADDMTRCYQRIKLAMMGLRPGSAGMVVVGSENRKQAALVWEKFCLGMDRFLGKTADFLGCLPEIRDSAALLSRKKTGRGGGTVQPELPYLSPLMARLLEEERTSEPFRSLELFLRWMESLTREEEVTIEEEQFFG